MPDPIAPESPRLRADARRSIDALLKAAKTTFATSGIDAPVREIASLAGVGLGTLYRHFPQRSDLISAVFQRELATCAAAATELSAELSPAKALEQWLWLYTDLLATKRGLAAAMNSPAPGYEALPGCFQEPLRPGLENLLKRATDAGQIRGDISSSDLMQAVACLCLPTPEDIRHTKRLVGLMLDGLRYGATRDKP
jgi:AcrR family transcriptional regulator